MRNLNLSHILVALTITLTACPDPVGDTYVTYEGDVYEGDEINNYLPSDDGDDDSVEKIAEPEETRLDIWFSTAWSALGPMQINPGELANFGTYMFRLTGEPNAAAMISTKSIIIATKDDSTDAFTPWMTSDVTGISLENHLETCVLRTQPSGTVYQGPNNPSDIPSVISFTDNFTMVVEEDGETYLPLQLTCATTNMQPEDEESGFAALWESSSFEAVDKDGEVVEWNIWADNGTWANPTVQVWLQNASGEEASILTLSRSVNSPSGAAVPSYQSILRFNVCADTAFDAELSSIKFEVDAVDNAGNDWSSCGILGQAISINLVNVSAPTTPIELFEWATDTSNWACDEAPETNKLGHVYMELAELIPAGTCSVYELGMDASGASDVQDDTVRVDIVDEEWLVWFDQNGDGHDGSDAAGLPLLGNTLQF